MQNSQSLQLCNMPDAYSQNSIKDALQYAVEYYGLDKTLPLKELINAARSASLEISDWQGILPLYSITGENQPDASFIGAALKEMAKDGYADGVKILCALKTDNRPSQESVNTALKTAADRGFCAIALMLCNITGDNRPDATAVGEALICMSGHRFYAGVEILCALKTDNRPSQESVSIALRTAHGYCDFRMIRQLCSITEDNRPDRITLERVIKNMLFLRQDSLVEVLCLLQADNKPLQQVINDAKKEIANRFSFKKITESKQNSIIVDCDLNASDAALRAAVSQYDWDTAVQLCSMTGENQPHPRAIENAFIQMARLGSKSSVEKLCSLQSENRPNRALVDKALIVAAKAAKFGIVEYLCKLNADNQPSQEAVSDALKAIVDIGLKATIDECTWDLVARLCKMQSVNKPNALAVEYALIQMAGRGLTLRVEKLCALQTDNRPSKKAISDARKQIESSYNPKIDNKPYVSKNHRQKIYTQIDAELTFIFSALNEKIGEINKHHFKETYDKSIALLRGLLRIKDNYLTSLKDVNMDIHALNWSFTRVCKTLINESSPIFERDLNWGEYLKNLLKSIANTMIWAISLGKYNTFFPPARSVSAMSYATFSSDIQRITNSIE